QRGIGEIRQI
ncbi:hypothetical protein TNCT_710561, partial [Trichonephila clavata]